MRAKVSEREIKRENAREGERERTSERVSEIIMINHYRSIHGSSIHVSKFTNTISINGQC